MGSKQRRAFEAPDADGPDPIRAIWWRHVKIRGLILSWLAPPPAHLTQSGELFTLVIRRAKVAL